MVRHSSSKAKRFLSSASLRFTHSVSATSFALLALASRASLRLKASLFASCRRFSQSSSLPFPPITPQEASSLKLTPLPSGPSKRDRSDRHVVPFGNLRTSGPLLERRLFQYSRSRRAAEPSQDDASSVAASNRCCESLIRSHAVRSTRTAHQNFMHR